MSDILNHFLFIRHISKTFDIFDFKFGGGMYSQTYQSRCIASKYDYNLNIYEFCYLNTLNIIQVEI